MPWHIPWDRIDHHFLAYLHIIGSVSPWLGSCTYHLFMSHKCGCELYTQLLRWDVISILITQTFGASTTIYTSIALYPYWLQCVFVFLYTFLAIRVLQYTLEVSCVWKRRLGFALLVFMRVIAFFLRLWSIGIGKASVS